MQDKTKQESSAQQNSQVVKSFLQEEVSFHATPRSSSQLKKSYDVTDEEQEDYIKSKKVVTHFLVQRMLGRVAFGVCSILVPIYVAEKYPNLPVACTAWIMTIQTFTQSFGLFVAGKFVARIGHKRSLLFGSIFAQISNFFFAASFIIQSQWSFFWLSMISRGISGFCLGFVANSAMSVGAFKFPAEREAFMAKCAMMDFFGGFIGMLITIILCSFIELPAILLVTVGFTILYTIISFCLIPAEFDYLGESSGENKTEGDSIAYSRFLTNAVSAQALLFQLLCIMCMSFTVAISSQVLSEVGFTDAMVGLICAIAMFMAVIVVSLIKNKIRQLKPYNIRLVGLILLVAGYTMVIWVNKVTATFLSITMGVACGLVLICGLPDIVAGTEKAIRMEYLNQGKKLDQISVLLEDKASAMAGIAQTLGISFGSVIGGRIYDSNDRDISSTAITFVIIAACILVFFVVLTYVVFNAERIRDYETLDGVSNNNKSLTRIIKTNQNKDDTAIIGSSMDKCNDLMNSQAIQEQMPLIADHTISEDRILS